MSGRMSASEFEAELTDDIAEFYDDPYGFVLYAFPWGEKGTMLEDFDGPDTWQKEQLTRVGNKFKEDPETTIRESISSGHGIGKSAEVSWIILWAMSTRPHLSGVVTANTTTQLNTKTWRELALWHKLSINEHWFTWSATAFKHKEHPETWAVNAIPNTEHNSEAFAGLHAQHVLVIYDEACHEAGTEVLTEHGWMDFADLTGDERLFSKNTETQEVELQHPTALARHEYRGPMHRCDRRGLAFSVTPNHRMLHSTQKKPDTWKLTEIAALRNTKYPMHKSLGALDSVEASDSLGFNHIPREAFYRFLGWYFSEGHTQHNTVTLSQSAESEGLADMLACFEEVAKAEGSEIKLSGMQYRILAPRLAEWLRAHGAKSWTKRLPEGLFNSPKHLQLHFLQAFIAGDGTWYEDKKQAAIYSSSEEMADQLQAIALRAGGYACKKERAPSGRIDFGTHIAHSTRRQFVVYWMPEGHEKSQLLPSKDISVEEYEGMVYCATVPNGTLYTRWKGHCMWSGNSGIPDKIWEVSEGAMTTPRAMWFNFGNPTKNTGRFVDCHTSDSDRWEHHKIDSRTCKMTNKKEIAEWVKIYGEDSDFVRVRVRGEFPRAGSMQFIASDTVDSAMAVEFPLETYMHLPVIISVDVARYGDDKSVIAIRQGRKVHELRKYREHNTMQLVVQVVVAIKDYEPGIIFVDGVGVGAGVVDRLVQLGHEIMEINAGNKADDEVLYYNKRIEMWDRLRSALRTGLDLPYDPDTRKALIGVEYGFDDKEKMRLERKKDMKKRGLNSPDEGDALAGTYAYEVGNLHKQSFEPDDSFE